MGLDAMYVEIQFFSNGPDSKTFLTWRPSRAEVRLQNIPSPSPQSVKVQLRSHSMVDGGAVVFSTMLHETGQDTIDIALPLDGSPVEVWVGGKFGSASKSFGDVSIKAQEVTAEQLIGPELASLPLMVRVRKDAETLTNKERDRFLSAMTIINGQGRGRWSDLRDMHEADAYRQIHVNYSFLPWHRAYLLNLERELQLVDPEVALPYWRFDEPAPKLIQPSFIGRGRRFGSVQFSSTNPLRNWVGEGQVAGVRRGDGVGPNNVIPVRTEIESLQISTGPNANFTDFCDWNYASDRRTPLGLEAGPHNGAHGYNGTGWITRPTTSQRDPLFYLLHANVDRLWAKWQWLPDGTVGSRSDPDSPVSYVSGWNLPDGHNRDDTLWPWDGVMGDQVPSRPPNAPGGGMLDSPMTSAPGPQPRVKDMIDYLGANGGGCLGFAYDDVPFEV